MMKREEMEIVVKMSHPEHGLMTRHFKTVELEHADAEYLCNTLLDQFTVQGINLSELLISVMTDGTNVMIGHKSGVIKRIMDIYNGVHLVGSCTDHHLNNSHMKKVQLSGIVQIMRLNHLIESQKCR